MRCDRLWHKARLATLAGGGLGIVEDGVVASQEARIVYAGPAGDAPQLDAAERIDCDGRWITPGLIDCHTHLIYAGDRAAEFEMRLGGASYEDIAKAGGGILSTVKATRAASEAELTDASLPRLDALIAEGVTTVEIKSGYGLSLEHESKMLRAARALAAHRKIAIATTFLGAHALPPEFGSSPAQRGRGTTRSVVEGADVRAPLPAFGGTPPAGGGRTMDDQKDAYVDLVCREMIPAVARDKLADAVDAFCEGIAFSHEQTERVFEAAKAHGLGVKLHADQLSNTGGAALAAKFGALSGDHLEHTDEAGIAAMAEAGTVAVLLPGAFYFLRETKAPPVELLRRHHVPIAIGTDCNPGTSPLTSILLCLNMAATCFRLTVEECLAGVTANAARALGRADIGTLEAGKRCDLAIWNIERPAELVYRMGFNPLHTRVFGGEDG